MTAETDFRVVFSHLDAVANYARRRGSTDADALAAEVMTIAWRRLPDVPKADPRPWLFATARNLLLAEFRARGRTPHVAERGLPRARLRRARLAVARRAARTFAARPRSATARRLGGPHSVAGG